MWYISIELSADKFVDNVNMVNYTFLLQICGDFSALSKMIITIIHHIWFCLVHWKILPTHIT